MIQKSVAIKTSSFRMVPEAFAVAIVAPPLGLLSVTVNPSSGSTIVSPAMGIVIVFAVSPAVKMTAPDGNTPPTKSAPSTGFAPSPMTEKVTVVSPLVSPLRVTVNVNGVLPASPSAFTESVAAMDNSVPPSEPIVKTPSTGSLSELVGAGTSTSSSRSLSVIAVNVPSRLVIKLMRVAPFEAPGRIVASN